MENTDIKMKLTNKYNLSNYIVKTLSQDNYDYEEDVWSASTLKMPSRMFALSKLNRDKLETDVSDIIPARFGTAVHLIFENTDLEEFGFTQERRMYGELLNQKISGKYDLKRKLSENFFRLYDIKSTSVYKYVYKDFKDYIIQLSIYRWLGIKNGEQIDDKATIIFIFTDWMKSRINHNNYPQLRIVEQEIDLMTFEETEEYIKKKITSHRDALKELPRCSDEELWKKKPEDLPKRCDYCSCRNFCEQYKEMVKK